VSREHVTHTGTYVYDQDWGQERQRLAGMEELWDPGTTELIESLGIAPGWRCLEVGAGSGSVAEWLAQQTGAQGEVLATDVNLRHLEDLDVPGLAVRQHDILTDPLPSQHFDLVHARLVVEHLGDRALERMLPSLRAGGWLVVESFDWVIPTMYPEDEPARRAIDTLLLLMSSAGFDPKYGRKLVHALESQGLQEVRAEGRVAVYRGGSAAAAFLALSLESQGGALLESGLSGEDLHAALAAMRDPNMVFVSPPMIAAWGLKPGPT
jgi:SAM-dependent methyltransferase